MQQSFHENVEAYNKVLFSRSAKHTKKKPLSSRIFRLQKNKPK